MKSPTLIVLAVLAIASAGTVLAAPQDGAKPERRTLDANGDGVVDRAEAAASPRLAERFDSLDRNGDGRLDKDELRQGRDRGHRGREGHARLQALDADKDGRISRAEAAADPAFAARFERMDLNGDGFIDRADRELAAAQRRDAWFKAADTNGDGMLSRAEFDAADRMHAGRDGHRHGPHATRGDRMATLDKDGDGRISRAEAADSPLAARFDSLDANKDGFLDRDELKAARPQRR